MIPNDVRSEDGDVVLSESTCVCAWCPFELRGLLFGGLSLTFEESCDLYSSHL